MLENTYKPEEYIFYSSPSSRTIFSATGIIESMFPGSIIKPLWQNNEKLRSNDIPPIKNFDLNSTEITLIIKDQDGDNLFHTAKCKLSKNNDMNIYDMIENKKVINISEDEIKNALYDIRKRVPSLYDDISEDMNIDEVLEKMCGFFLPVDYHYEDFFGLSNETLDTLKKGQIQRIYKKRMDETSLTRYVISPIFDIFKDLLSKYSSKSNKLKFALLSGHDTNIADILVNIFDKNYIKNKFNTNKYDFRFVIPPFASSFIIELHSSVSNLKNYDYVRILYNGEILRSGFDKDLIYDVNHDGIRLDIFISFLNKKIDRTYKNLYCKKRKDEIENLLNSYLIK